MTTKPRNPHDPCISWCSETAFGDPTGPVKIVPLDDASRRRVVRVSGLRLVSCRHRPVPLTTGYWRCHFADGRGSHVWMNTREKFSAGRNERFTFEKIEKGMK